MSEVKNRILDYARMGAAVRLTAIDQERAAILRAFPDLRSRRHTFRSLVAPSPAARVSAKARPAQSTRRFTGAQRRAISKRMKAYWAERRVNKS
jgi:hypothetical protein